LTFNRNPPAGSGNQGSPPRDETSVSTLMQR
jgi:hypothetical protein